MAGEVVFDTDVLIDAGRGVTTALDVLNEAAKKHTLAISAITEMELIVGCRNKVELRVLDGFLSGFWCYRLENRSLTKRSACCGNIASVTVC